MTTGMEIWKQYADELDKLFRELLQAKYEGDKAQAQVVMQAIGLLADSYVETEPLVLALDERAGLLALGCRVDN